MNLANKITLGRVIAIPFFVLVILSDIFSDPTRRYVGIAIFILASLSDALDGYIARSRNLVTNFGKFMDPLADKLLVSAALIALVELGNLPAWVVIIIISREFIITGFRLIASDNKVVIAASFWGKVKTITQMIMIIVVMFDFQGSFFYWINFTLIALAVFFTVLSAVDYVVKNIAILKM